MPLHEYLEQKRRQNITQLNASGACHICGSTCRNSQGFSHFMDNEDKNAAAAAAGGGYHHENSMVPPPNLAAIRTCACFGISPSDPDFWPYSIRVCDKCIEDDKGIGRIRNCGICGTVACDENCGSELLECTDCVEWNNAGCLECRNMADFSDMDIFRNENIPRANGGEPRITRICAKCLEMSTPWVKFDFVCRRFRCETRLVPSDIAERKRFCTFGSSPLNLLPEDGLVAVVDFLSVSDLKQLFLTCSAMCTVAERVAKEKVERVAPQYPTGPIVVTKRKDGFGQVKNWTHFKGKNDFSLRAPDDDKAWVGVYHYLEKVTKEMFYFGFQMTGAEADKEVVGKFLNQTVDKFTFGQAYSKTENDLVPCDPVGLSVRGGCVLVTREGENTNVSPVPLTIASSRSLVTGTHRIICRLFCPGLGGGRSNRDATTYRLGSIGILRTNQMGDGPTTSWAQRADIMESWLNEDVVVGIEYNADERELAIHSNSHLSRSSRFVSHRYAVAETPGDLYIAAELTQKSANVMHSLLSIRECNAAEWSKFIDHMEQGNPTFGVLGGNANGADIFDPMDMEAMAVAGGDRGAENNPRIRHQMREVMRHHRPMDRMDRRRRERDNDNDEGGNLHRVQLRALDEGRREPVRRDVARDAVPGDVEGLLREGLNRVIRRGVPAARRRDIARGNEAVPAEGEVDGLLREGLRVIRRGGVMRPAARAAGYRGRPDPDVDDVDDDNSIPDGFALQEGVLPRIQRLVPAARPFAQAAARAEEVHSEAPSSDDASDDDTASLFVEGAEEEFVRFNDILEADA